ncbi:hypothetical protein Patl1_27431 [Pistacia atlantica]|uniref:Uncharacterized protein n=1 Tax=Pistacia atlantica TaxID=434234 RepID=A0ACC1BEG4_9ROSI|nr:hypothetical protein Patl1_27431 [Pistacia atlantica]
MYSFWLKCKCWRPPSCFSKSQQDKSSEISIERKGDYKVDLEAKNVFGETPLHVAAKNGCKEAARLLLAHGAPVEAKTKALSN